MTGLSAQAAQASSGSATQRLALMSNARKASETPHLARRLAVNGGVVDVRVLGV